MIITKCYITLFFLLIGIGSFAQDAFYESYDWELKPEYTITASDSDDIITYKEKIVTEFGFDDKDAFVEYLLEHKVIWLNSDKQIEDNNKIYLPHSSTTEILVNKARVVTKEGKVIELDDSKILTAEDEETKRIYKYFAFEGVEKGSFVEYMYVLKKKNPSYKGDRLTFQTSYPKYNVEFDLFAPTNLVFEFKSYNGLDSIQEDTNMTEKYHWYLQLDSVPALEREDQSPYHASKKFLIYKMDRNTSTNISDISSYASVAKNVFSFLYDNATKSETKALNKLIKSTEANSNDDLIGKIRTIENYVKKTYFMVDTYSDDLRDIKFILDNKITDKSGIIKLYARIFKIMGIKNQLVLTCDRKSIRFDKEFESANFLIDYLFYFPKIKSYMSPIEIGSRLGFPPTELTNNYGLFIKEVSVGDFKTGIGKIRFIDAAEYDKSYDNILVDVEFNSEDITEVKMAFDRSTGGYSAQYIQPYLNLIDDKNKKELIETQIKYLNEDIEITNKKVYNDSTEAFGIKPLRVTATVTSDAFVEKAGNKYLFKIGELIGPQMEMYQEKKRILPVETDFTRNYHRELSFTIPDGYKVNNLDDINIENNYKRDEEIIFNFKSSYTIEGNKVIVVSDEYYTIVEIAPEIYEEYRRVINSAADFNKVTLILEAK